MREYKRTIYQTVKKRALEPRRYIQTLLGPRQVGKTTLVQQVCEDIEIATHYVTADLATLEDISWLISQWEIARELAREYQQAILIIDEVQKIPHWSDTIKMLWDQDTQHKTPLKVFMLGSSPWLIQSGISESLAGRFEIIPITHWSYQEMQECFGWGLEEYIYFGGYPGAGAIANPEDPSRWKHYISDSLIETAISRDILLMTQVNKPALLRRLFQLGCIYSGHILSYQKMLGQLQDAGNTTTLAHYLNLLNGAGLLSGISKYANAPVRQRSSSPRFMVYNTALLSAQSAKDFSEAKKDSEYWGHLVESCIGSHLLNSIRGTSIELYYWRSGNKEVDFVLKKGDKLIAIEVKSGKKKESIPGLDEFNKQFTPTKLLVIGKQGISIESFLTKSAAVWFE